MGKPTYVSKHNCNWISAFEVALLAQGLEHWSSKFTGNPSSEPGVQISNL